MSSRDSPGTPPEEPSTVGPAPAIAPGMEVVDVGGVPLGTVKAVRDADFHLSRELERDVYVPLRYVAETEGRRVRLTLRTGDVSVLDLDTPPLL
jgi:Uncharacterized protein conserved in bacteria (DUF2171)